MSKEITALKESSFKKLKALQNVILAKKQGEALERVSTPQSPEEAMSLGHYEASTNVALNLLITVESLINDICGIDGSEITDLALNISRASANRQAKRIDRTLETVGQLGQYTPFPKGQIPTPQAVDLNQ